MQDRMRYLTFQKMYNEKRAFAGKDMRGVRQAVFMAKKVGKSLG